mgnify:CR=1 FL=1
MVDDDQPTYGYKGCFRDRPDRVLRGFNKVTEFNDLEFCANTCYKKGKGSFFHLQPFVTSNFYPSKSEMYNNFIPHFTAKLV